MPPPRTSPIASRACPSCAPYCETRASPRFVGGGSETLRLASPVSLRQFLQPEPDQLLGLRALACAARRGGNRGGGLRMTVTEIDQCGDRIRDRLRRTMLIHRAGKPDHRRIDVGIS